MNKDEELEFWKSIANHLIDDWCDIYGVRETIEHLYNFGCSKEELLFLDFEEEDIDAVIKYLKGE